MSSTTKSKSVAIALGRPRFFECSLLSPSKERLLSEGGILVQLANKTLTSFLGPCNDNFADRDLTTWLPRRWARADNIVVAALVSSADRR